MMILELLRKQNIADVKKELIDDWASLREQKKKKEKFGKKMK